MVYHPSKAFKSDIFRRGKPKQQGRQLLQKELPVQAARRGAWRRLQGMGGPWPPYPADGDDNVSDGVWPAGLEDWPECVEVAMMSFHDQPQSNTCPIIVYGNHSWIPAVNCSQYHPWVEANIASPTKRWSAENCRKQSGQSRLVKVGLAWSRVFFVPCGVVADGHHKQRAILRRKQIPGWGGHLFAISTAPQPSAFSYLRLQAGPRHSEVCLGRAGWVVWRCFKFVAYLTCQSFEGYDYVLNQYLLSNRGTACCICCAQSKSSQGIAMCHDRLVHTHDISWKWWWWWWWRRWWFFQV